MGEDYCARVHKREHIEVRGIQGIRIMGPITETKRSPPFVLSLSKGADLKVLRQAHHKRNRGLTGNGIEGSPGTEGSP